MIKPDISVQDKEARIFFQDENFSKIIFDDERCVKIIVEKLSFEISNDSYIIKDISKIKKNKLIRLERVVREFYDKDILSKSSISEVDDSITRLVKHDSIVDTPISRETLALFSGNENLFVKYVYDDSKAYRAYVEGEKLVLTNYIYQKGLDDYDLTFEKVIGKMNFDDINDFIDVFNIE